MPGYIDLAGAGVPEDDRIRMIGESAMAASQKGVGVVVDDEPEKIKRYKRKFFLWFPELEIFSEGKVRNGVYGMAIRRRIGNN